MSTQLEDVTGKKLEMFRLLHAYARDVLIELFLFSFLFSTETLKPGLLGTTRGSILSLAMVVCSQL